MIDDSKRMSQTIEQKKEIAEKSRGSEVTLTEDASDDFARLTSAFDTPAIDKQKTMQEKKQED